MKTGSGQCAAAFEVSRERPFAVRRSKSSEPGRQGIEDAYMQSATYPASVFAGAADARTLRRLRRFGAHSLDDARGGLVDGLVKASRQRATLDGEVGPPLPSHSGMRW